MPDTEGPPRAGFRARTKGFLTHLIASRGFQAWAARMPGLRRVARAEGAALFDLIGGFVYSQILMALVELRILQALHDHPKDAASLAPAAGLTPERMQVLLQAGAALGLLKRRRDGRFALARRGAALLGVPGLSSMIRHHAILYRDLADPVAFLRQETDPDLARFWPYVFGAAAVEDPVTAQSYSKLMANSQVLVAEDTLQLVDLTGATHLMDVGGGTGVFLSAVAAKYPDMNMTLFDLPAVVDAASDSLAAVGLMDRVTILPGTFRDHALPRGADVISLIRVLYDHGDDTVMALLSSVHDALPPGGQIVISEPMSGGGRPDRTTDTYFAFYTMAMQTGRTRSAAEIAALLKVAGFTDITPHQGYRPFVTSAITARRVGGKD